MNIVMPLEQIGSWVVTSAEYFVGSAALDDFDTSRGGGLLAARY